MARTDRTGTRAHLSAMGAGVVLALAGATATHARTAAPTTIAAMARSAAHVFRGRCSAVAVETIEIAGARLSVTAYTFRVREHLKGHGGSTITFRQVGTPDGGPRDLGRLVGLPVYAPGTDYVLFLLPDSPAGVTSPAGAAEGAFIVRDDAVASVRGTAMPPAPAVPAGRRSRSATSGAPAGYEALRRAVLEELAR